MGSRFAFRFGKDDLNCVNSRLYHLACIRLKVPWLSAEQLQPEHRR